MPRSPRRILIAAAAALVVIACGAPAAGAYAMPSLVVPYPSTAPGALAISPDGSALIVARRGNAGTPTLTRFNVDDFANALPIDIYNTPTPAWVAVAFQGRIVGVRANGDIGEIYPSLNTPVGSGPEPLGGASDLRDLAPAPGYPVSNYDVFVLNGPNGSAGSLIKYTGVSPGVVSTVTSSLPQQATALAVDPTGTYGYVTHTYDPTVKRVNLTTGAISSLSIGVNTSLDIVVDSAGAYAYIAGSQGVVTRLRLSDFSVAGTSADLGDGALNAITMSADGRFVFTSFEASGGLGPSTFVALDASTLEVVRTVALPENSDPGSIAAAAGYAYVALPNAGLGSVVRIELKPDPPTGVSATAGDGSARVAFTLDDAQVRTIEYSVDEGDWTAADPAGTSSPITIRGLTNGRTHSIRLRAVDGLAASDPSAAVTVTPRAADAATTGSAANASASSGRGALLRTTKAKVRGNAITTSFTASGPGTATITGTVATSGRAGAATVCTGKATVRRKGTVRMTCTFTKQGRALRAKGAVQVSLAVTFRTTAGLVFNGKQSVRLSRS